MIFSWNKTDLDIGCYLEAICLFVFLRTTPQWKLQAAEFWLDAGSQIDQTIKTIF